MTLRWLVDTAAHARRSKAHLFGGPDTHGVVRSLCQCVCQRDPKTFKPDEGGKCVLCLKRQQIKQSRGGQ